jgi:hypothetical protein
LLGNIPQCTRKDEQRGEAAAKAGPDWRSDSTTAQILAAWQMLESRSEEMAEVLGCPALRAAAARRKSLQRRSTDLLRWMV